MVFHSQHWCSVNVERLHSLYGAENMSVPHAGVVIFTTKMHLNNILEIVLDVTTCLMVLNLARGEKYETATSCLSTNLISGNKAKHVASLKTGLSMCSFPISPSCKICTLSIFSPACYSRPVSCIVFMCSSLFALML